MTMAEASKSAAGIFEKIKRFLIETRAELRKVIWPDRKYVAVATAVICAIVVLMGLFVMFVDFAFAQFFAFLEKAF